MTTDIERWGTAKLIGYLRANEDINFLMRIILKRFAVLEEITDELTSNLSISYAKEKWLDYIGLELNAVRDETDFGNYFCLNRSHCNVEKEFYFLADNHNPEKKIPLNDAEFLQKIYAYIVKNISFGRFEEVLTSLKLITRADSVKFSFPAPATVGIHLTGEGLLLTPSAGTYIQNTAICEGIYIKEITING